MGKQFAAIVMFLFVLELNANAGPEYAVKSACGSAKVIFGDTCSNVKVQMTFEGCDKKLETQDAQRIICKGSMIKARLQNGDYRFEAEFDKKSDGWGGVVWKPLSPLKQFVKKASANSRSVASVLPPSAAPNQVPQNPAALKPVVAAESKQAEKQADGTEKKEEKRESKDQAGTPPVNPLKFSGYFDVRYLSYTATANPRVAKPHAESGFLLDEGAVYLAYEKEQVSFFVDVPFRRIKDSDNSATASTSANSNQSSGNALTIGTERAQAYLKYQIIEKLNFTAGQFDSIYGIEGADSKDRFFARTAATSDAFLPSTHTGAMIDYSYEGAYIKAFSANPASRGSFGTATTEDENPEYGAALGFANENFRFQAGYLWRTMKKADAIDFASRTLWDLTAGVILGQFTFDVEYNLLVDPSKNTLTSDSADIEKAGEGILGIATYKLTDRFQLGARYEIMSNDPTAQQVLYTYTTAAGLHYRLSPELEARAEWAGLFYKSIGSVN